MTPMYISFYTRGNGYEEEAARLIETLDAFKLPHHVAGVWPETMPRNSTSGSPWRRATQYKAEFILTAFTLFPGRPLVWVDADARIIARPVMFNWLKCDIAAHWFRGTEMLSGTVYLAPRPVTRALVRSWIERNAKRPGGELGEQRNLQYLIERTKGLSIVNLPPEYDWIDAGGGKDLSWRVYGQRSPVIRHGQASRRLKHVPMQRSVQSSVQSCGSVREALKEPIVGIPAGLSDL